jgi:hypothetical protein
VRETGHGQDAGRQVRLGSSRDQACTTDRDHAGDEREVDEDSQCSALVSRALPTVLRLAQQPREFFAVVRGEYVDESLEDGASVMTVCEQRSRVFGRHRGFRDDRLIRVRPTTRTAHRRTLALQTIENCHDRGIRRWVSELRLYFAGNERRISRPEHAQYLLFEFAEGSPARLVVPSPRRHALHAMTVVVDDATTHVVVVETRRAIARDE